MFYLYFRFDCKFERFCALYVPNHVKTKLKKKEQYVGTDESKVCPLAASYDGNIHDALADLRRLDGNIPVHDNFGVPVNFFAPKGARKYWTRRRLHNWGIIQVHVLDCFDYLNYFRILNGQIFPVSGS